MLTGEQVETAERELEYWWLVTAGTRPSGANDALVGDGDKPPVGSAVGEAARPLLAAIVDVQCREESRGEQVGVGLAPAGNVHITKGRGIRRLCHTHQAAAHHARHPACSDQAHPQSPDQWLSPLRDRWPATVASRLGPGVPQANLPRRRCCSTPTS